MTILVFGASTVWGAHDNEGGGWVTRLRNEFFELNRTHVYNCGVSGDTSSDVLKRFPEEAQARAKGKQAIVIISVGLNDSVYAEVPENTIVSMDDFKQNLLVLIAEARKISDRVIVLGHTHVDESKVQPVPWAEKVNYCNRNIDTLNSIIQAVCADTGVACISIIDEFDTSDLHDGLHLNTKGHTKLHEIVREYLIANKMLLA